MCGGPSQPPVKNLTPEEMVAMTDNRFENPVSGVSAPSWKPDEVKKEKEEIEAQKAADKLKVDTAEVTPRASSSGSSGGVVSRNRKAAQAKRGYSRGNPTKSQTAARSRRK